MTECQRPDLGALKAYNLGCRCDRCRLAKREWFRAYRERGPVEKPFKFRRDAGTPFDQMVGEA